MERAKHQANFYVHNRIARNNAVYHSFLDSVFGWLYVFLGDYAADNFVDEFVVLALFQRLENDFRMPILAAAARLADKLADAGSGLRDSFAVGDLRLAGIGLNLEFAEKSVTDNFQVKLAHTRNEGLSGFLVRGDDKCRVFFCQALKSD